MHQGLARRLPSLSRLTPLPPPRRHPPPCLESPAAPLLIRRIRERARRSRHPELLGEPRVSPLPLLQLGALGIDLLECAARQQDWIRDERLSEIDDCPPAFVVVVVSDGSLMVAAEDEDRPVVSSLYHSPFVRGSWETRWSFWETRATRTSTKCANSRVRPG